MPQVDLDVVGKKTEPKVFDYSWKDVVLYALGIGPDTGELSLVYENAPGGLKVLPSFCVVPAIRAFPDCGPDINWSLMLHGEMQIQMFDLLPQQDVSRLKQFKARFCSSVYPGDTLTTGG